MLNYKPSRDLLHCYSSKFHPIWMVRRLRLFLKREVNERKGEHKVTNPPHHIYSVMYHLKNEH